MNKKLVAILAAATLSVGATTASAGFMDNLFGPKKQVVQLNQTTEQAVLNNKLWLFNDQNASSWTVEKAKKGKSYILTQATGSENFLDTELQGDNLVNKDGKYKISQPTQVSFEKNGSMILHYGPGKKPIQVAITLIPYDIGGQKISEFLRGKDGTPSAAAANASGKFP